MKNEYTANRQLAATAAQKKPEVRPANAFQIARIMGVDPYNDTRGMAVRS